jgi:ribosomal protein S24E
MIEFEILNQTENPLFKRTEIEMQIKSQNPPTKKQAVEFLSKKYSSSDGVHIESIKGKFGSNVFKVIARVYKSKEEKNLTEARSKKQIEKEKKEEEAAAKEKAEAEKPSPSEGQEEIKQEESKE